MRVLGGKGVRAWWSLEEERHRTGSHLNRRLNLRSDVNCICYDDLSCTWRSILKLPLARQEPDNVLALLPDMK